VSDLFASLVDRALGRAPLLPVRRPGMFAPASPWFDPVVEELEEVPDGTRRGPPAEPPRVEIPAAATPASRRRPAPPVTVSPAPAPPAGTGVEHDVLARPERPTVASPVAVPEEEPAPRTTRLELAALVASALDRPAPQPPGPQPAPSAAAPPERPARPERPPTSPVAEPPVLRVRPPEPPPAPANVRESAAPPAVEIRIGRIEVKAAPAPRPQPAARTMAPRPASVPLPLKDYLQARGRRR